jgi:hypothetical protein
MTLEQIESRLLSAWVSIGAQLPQKQLDEVSSLTKAGEPRIALENLCTQSFEFDASVSKASRDELGTLGTAMAIRPEYWTRLRVKG